MLNVGKLFDYETALVAYFKVVLRLCFDCIRRIAFEKRVACRTQRKSLAYADEALVRILK